MLHRRVVQFLLRQARKTDFVRATVEKPAAEWRARVANARREIRARSGFRIPLEILQSCSTKCFTADTNFAVFIPVLPTTKAHGPQISKVHRFPRRRAWIFRARVA
jgi:hypothetical protein